MNVLNFQSTVMFMSAVQLYLKRIVLSMCASKEFSIASIAFEFPALDLVYSMINLKKVAHCSTVIFLKLFVNYRYMK